ncbi:MAG: DEAD/DEAH box helicase [Beijerinckiaceae bacterium]|nr:DEAD/DEAH box helicase [Beijerinckiaceae bacterium]
MTFEELGLGARVTAAVTAAGYTTPTPIQAQAIPEVLKRRDVLGIAQTGTGKTAAFTLPMLSILEQGRARARMPRTLILEPTRELAMQVEEKFKEYGANQKLTVALLIGGVSFAEQDLKITRGVDVLIATPGRLLDHVERGKLLLSGIDVLVIDEADRMLDMGFIPDIERIVKLTPFTRQTLFFTATMPPEIQRITEQFLTNPVVIKVDRTSSTASTITQRLVASGRKDFEKREVLRKLIREATDLKNGIIFCNRKIDVASLHRSLMRHDFSVASLHGDMDQSARMAALDAFRKNKITLMVASDVAARGLDIPDVSHVFNFDIPIHAEDYVHRIGRTGRAGRAGTAYTIVDKSDQKYLDAIEKLIDNKIEWLGPNLDDFVSPESDDDGHERSGGRGGNRGREHSSSSRGRERPERTAREGRPAREAKPSRETTADETRPARVERPRGGPEADAAAPRAPRARDELQRHDRTRQERPADDRPGYPRTERPRRPEREDDGPMVVGFGDQLPGFLSRPVPVKKRA